ncbi:unnamed protein product, partial [marine sediment metagenome]
MPYDKYRNWKKQGFVDDGIKLQVIKDLEDTKDPIDKLEILDSFEVYVERNQQEELAEHFALLVLNYAIRPLLVEFAKSKMPGSMPISRGRA